MNHQYSCLPTGRDEFSKMFVFLWEYFRGIGLKFRENKKKLLQASVVNSLKKAALLDTIRRGYLGSDKITLFEFLESDFVNISIENLSLEKIKQLFHY